MPAIIVDAGDCVTEINSHAEGFLNLSVRQVRNMPLWQMLLVDEALKHMLAKSRATDMAITINELLLGSAQREATRVNVQIAPLAGRTGQMLILISPQELAGQLVSDAAAQRNARSAIGMAEMLVHEIKNPLAGITGAAQLLGMNLSGQDAELTELIVSESHRIVDLLDQVEQFGDQRPPNAKPVNLHAVLSQARRSALLGFGAHMTIVEDYDPSLPDAWADADQLQQVIQNLLRNASEAAARSGGVITLSSAYDSGFGLRRADGAGVALPLQIEIADNGPGLPDALRDTVFEPFVSGRENGSGLGLALANKIISAHNGWISVTSEPGHTVFRIALPRADQRRTP